MQSLHPSWIPLTSEEELQHAWQASYTEPVVVFKHSTRCGISIMALNNLVRNWDFPEASFRFYYLDLLKYRSISNTVARMAKVQHQSPQLIIWKDGETIADFSHGEVMTSILAAALENGDTKY